MARAEKTSKRGMFSWALYDWANSVFFTLIQTFVFAAYFTRAVAVDETVGTAQWGNMLALSGLVIGLGGPVLGAIADRTGRRKPWILFFTLLCVAPTAFLVMIRPDVSMVWIALLLVGLATIAAEYAMIFYNSMLPDLVSFERVGRWSGWGWGLGYVGGLICLILALYGLVNEGAWITLERKSALHVRSTALLAAGWYLVFAIPFFLFTPDTGGEKMGLGRAAREGLGQLRESLRRVRDYRPIFRFLIARMIYNDGLATMFAFGGIYAAGTFGMSTKEVILFGIGLNVTAGIGAAAFAWLDDWLGPRKTILWSLVGLIVPGTVILFAQTKGLFWIFGLILGLFVGPVQASSRSYLAKTAPEEVRTQMFGLFALSGKLTTFLGPLMVGWLTLAAGSQRVGMSSIMALFLVGGLLMFMVPPVGEAKKQAGG